VWVVKRQKGFPFFASLTHKVNNSPKSTEIVQLSYTDVHISQIEHDDFHNERIKEIELKFLKRHFNDWKAI